MIANKPVKRSQISKSLLVAASAFLLGGCATGLSISPAELTALPGDRLAFKIEQFGICNTAFDRPVELDPTLELVVIVHGCLASAGQYEVMADAFKAQGKQAYCFNYDDRDRISDSAQQLAQVLDQLVNKAKLRKITVLGHSQGGLIARRALVKEKGLPLTGTQTRLVTISAPFGGIRAAAHCGSRPHSLLSFGIVNLVCQIITGNKWTEIPPGVPFVEQPGTLQDAVTEHFKIVTDERGSCRVRNEQGKCIEDDDVFSIDEQRQTVVDADRRVREMLVKAGHVEIVGSGRYPPKQLIEILTQK